MLDHELVGDLRDIQQRRPDAIRELVERYCSNSRQRLSELRAAVAAGDLELTRRCLHSMRGAAAGLGLAGLAHALAACEHAPETLVADARALDALQSGTECGVQALRATLGLE